jgi:tight adherence protein C
VPASTILLLLSVGIFALIVLITLSLTAPAQTASVRLAAYLPSRPGSPGTYAYSRGMRQRLVGPAFGWLLELAARTAPDRVRKSAAAELGMAGSSMSPSVFLGLRGLAMFGIPLLAALYVLSAEGQPTLTHWLVLGMAILWGRRLPTFMLKRRIKARQKLIDRRLPYALDLLVACLEGGLSLDAALAKVAEQGDGPLTFEIRRTLQEMALGRPAEDAMRSLGDRTGAPDLKRLTDNVVQAERMGVSIADALRQLARDSRVRRRQRAEEMARKAPIKMVPVLIFCVLPALGIVVMVPAVILLVRTLGAATPQ